MLITGFAEESCKWSIRLSGAMREDRVDWVGFGELSMSRALIRITTYALPGGN